MVVENGLNKKNDVYEFYEEKEMAGKNFIFYLYLDIIQYRSFVIIMLLINSPKILFISQFQLQF